MRRATTARLLAAAAAGCCLAPAAAALTPLDSVQVSSDVPVVLAATPLADRDVARDDLAGNVLAVDVGALPAGADLVGFHRLAGGDRLLAIDRWASLPGPLVAGPADVVRFDGAGFALALDGGAAGVPPGARIDAVAHTGTALLVSFDVAVDLGGALAADEDLVAFDGSAFAPFFDGGDAGVPAALDLDAAHLLSNGHLLLSFDGGGTIGGVVFADEDVLELDPAAASWELAYDGSARHPGWVAADLDALAAVEGAGPGGTVQLSAAAYTVFENGGSATITATRTGGAAGAMTVAFATGVGAGPGAATPGIDFVPASGTLSWADGDAAPKTFTVTLLDDDLLEAAETVPLALSLPPRGSGTAVLGTPAAATLSILDDDALSAPAVDIPTLSPWTLALLAALLAAGGWRRLRGVLRTD